MEPRLERGEASQGSIHLRRRNLRPREKYVAFLHAEGLYLPAFYDTRGKSVCDCCGNGRRLHFRQRQALLKAEGLIESLLLQDACIYQMLTQAQGTRSRLKRGGQSGAAHRAGANQDLAQPTFIAQQRSS